MLRARPTTPAAPLADALARDLAAIDSFHRARHAAEYAARAVTASRERRMDAARRVDVVRREHEALIARSEQALRATGDVLARTRQRTALVAHRQPWFVSKVSARFEERGVRVAGATEVGADVVGWALAERPDLVLVEDTLAMLRGPEVVQEIRRFCSEVVIGAVVPSSDRVAPMLAAGASTVHVRSVPPARVVDELLDLVNDRSARLPAG